MFILIKYVTEEILSNINRILNSYEKLHEYEVNGCTSEEIKKELQLLKSTTENLYPLMMKLFKENQSKIKGVSTLASIFKVTFLPLLKIHLLYLSQINESNPNLLKIQSRLAITYLNIDGSIDNLRIIHSYLK